MSGCAKATGAYAASRWALQLGQVDPGHFGNDDWKAGVLAEKGMPSLAAFSAVKGTTIMAWVPLGGERDVDVLSVSKLYHGARSPTDAVPVAGA